MVSLKAWEIESLSVNNSDNNLSVWLPHAWHMLETPILN